jgi:hypothetical protein
MEGALRALGLCGPVRKDPVAVGGDGAGDSGQGNRSEGMLGFDVGRNLLDEDAFLGRAGFPLAVEELLILRGVLAPHLV